LQAVAAFHCMGCKGSRVQISALRPIKAIACPHLVSAGYSDSSLGIELIAAAS
jgi:hypothetical protein